MEPQKNDKTEKRSHWDMRPYLAIGGMAFIVFCCCLVVGFVFFRFDKVAQVWSKIMGALQPIIIGGILAYLLNPILCFLESRLQQIFLHRAKDKAAAKKNIRVVASIATILFFILIVVMIFYLMIPALIASITRLVDSMDERLEAFIIWYENYDFKLNLFGKKPIAWENYLTTAINYVRDWFDTSVVPRMQEYVTVITSGVYSFVIMIKNVLIGLIVAVYMLMDKERFEGQTKKILFACLPTETANNVLQTTHQCNKIFGGFVIGKIIDSIIIGLICFIVCTIIQMPYTLLVSVIVGITNIIPFFGPLIGAVPCLIIITINRPLYGLYFLIFILILQQVDGNIIGPKILGNTTGLSSFWVIFAIMIGSSLFGVSGMLIGVPVFAVIYYLVKRLIEHLLQRKKLTVDTLEYTTVTSVNPENGQLKRDDWNRYESYQVGKKKQKKKKTEQKEQE